MEENKVLFSGEAQLMAWGESMQTGAWVKLWLHPEDLEHFKLMKARTGKHAGQRLGLAIVQIGDDEAVLEHPPADTPAPSPAPAPSPKALKVSPDRPKGGDNSRVAGIWCGKESFWRWASQKSGLPIMDADDAKEFVQFECELLERHPDDPSRAWLDNDPECERHWHQRIRIPFKDYIESEGIQL